MRRHVFKILALTLILTGACGATARPCPTPPAVAAATPSTPPRAGLQVRHTSVYVDDQDKALRFYTDVLGFIAKDDVRNGPYRWLTVTAPADPDGTELQLALGDNPAAKAYQQALFQQGQPAIMFYPDDVEGDPARPPARGPVFTMPPAEAMAGSIIAQLDDTCGNLIQITQLAR